LNQSVRLLEKKQMGCHRLGRTTVTAVSAAQYGLSDSDRRGDMAHVGCPAVTRYWRERCFHHSMANLIRRDDSKR
jgi:hypothetical protein